MRVLFVTAGVWDEEIRKIAGILKEELLWLGFSSENITETDLIVPPNEEDVLAYDALYFSGGWCAQVQQRLKQTVFDAVVGCFVYANKVYIGMSAGSVVASPNSMGCFGEPDTPETEGLGFLHAYLDCHCNLNPEARKKSLSLPHIMLNTYQALAVSNHGYELIEEPHASRTMDGIRPEEIFDRSKRHP